MKQSKQILSVLAMTALMPVHAFAQQTTRTSTTGGASYITPSGGGNAAESGRSAGNTQLITAAVNVGAAVMYVKVCGTGPTGSWACPLAAVAGVAANMLLGASGGSKSAGSAMSAYDPNFNLPGYDGGTGTTDGGLVYNPGGTNGTGTDGTSGLPGNNGTPGANSDTPLIPGTNTPVTPGTVAAGVDQVNKGLTDAGVTISKDGNTMTTKDGRKFNLGAGAGSDSGLTGMGLSAAEAALAMDASKKYAAQVASKYGQGKLAADGGGGGGGGARSPADAGAGGDGSNLFGRWGMDPRNKKREKAKVSGLTKKLGDDTIGVSGDDIFEMVTRRYKARDQENQFLKD